MILRPVLDLEREIRDLVAHGRRGPCTDAERRAGNHLAARLRDLGHPADVEPILVRPHTELTHVLHALLAVIGSAISVGAAPVGLAIAAAALVSAVLDLSGARLTPVRLLTFRRASQNVFSASQPEAAGTLVLVAGLDAPREGALHGSGMARARRLAQRVLRRRLGLAGPFVLALGVVVATTVLRVLEVESTALSAVQFVPTLVLLAAIVLLGDSALSPFSRGGAEAGGVAVTLALADELAGELEHFDVRVVLPGAETPGALGMRAWLRKHRAELDPARTVFVQLGTVGGGPPAYRHRAGAVFTTAFHPVIAEACAEVAARHGAARIPGRALTAALAARLRRYPATELVALDAPRSAGAEELDPESLERMRAFARGVLLEIDRRIGPRLG